MESLSQTFTYDAIGNQLSATDRRGILTRFTYDFENRRLTTTRASLTVETNQYDANGNRIFVADANGHKTGFEFDERNLLKAENRPLAAITRFVLDDMGDRIQRAHAEGRVTAWTHDLRRRQLSEARKMLPLDDSDDEDEVSCYDGNGNRVARSPSDTSRSILGPISVSTKPGNPTSTWTKPDRTNAQGASPS
jgi:YD repeat-containing protein